MRKSLYIKFVISYLILAFIGFFAVSMFGSSMVHNHLDSVYSTSLYQEATNIAQNQASKYYREQASLESVAQNLETLSKYQNVEIWLISKKGEILLNTASDSDDNKLTVIEDFNPGHSNGTYYQTGTFFNMFSTEHLSVMVPVTSQLNIQGYVAIHLPESVILNQQDQIMNIIYSLILIILLIMLCILLVFSFMVYQPLRKIIAGADAFASGNLKYNIPVHTNDEMGTLAVTLNYMSDELDKVNEYQRKFVANVSHDFRSPLTSIKGYTEAILDGTIPVEIQDKYLNIVVYETDRLYKLTESLLTLNDIDEKGRMLDFCDFDINAVVKSTAATFEGTCRKKRISIELVLTGQTLYVNADMGKIQQVLYNLIDNAIKFSSAESTIKIETSLKHETIFVSVKDSGCGIPKDSLNKIWDRFYKIDSSRGKDRKGTGLGLSIVKEIIRSHNQHINVISTEGVGTEFIFTLARTEEGNRPA